MNSAICDQTADVFPVAAAGGDELLVNGRRHKRIAEAMAEAEAGEEFHSLVGNGASPPWEPVNVIDDGIVNGYQRSPGDTS